MLVCYPCNRRASTPGKTLEALFYRQTFSKKLYGYIDTTGEWVIAPKFRRPRLAERNYPST